MYYDASPEYLATIYNKATRRRLIGTIGDVEFNGSDVVLGSFEVFNQCADNSDVKVGGVYVGQLNLVFVNSFFNKVPKKQFIGKVIVPYIGLYIPDNDEWEDIPLGRFTIKSASYSKDGIAIEAYDNMIIFDALYGVDIISGLPHGKPFDILKMICDNCGVSLGVTRAFVEALPNGQETFYLDDRNDIETHRDILYWIAQLTATFATIDREGRLVLRKFGSGGTTEFDETNRDVDSVYSDYVTRWTSVSVDSVASGETEVYYTTTDNGLRMNLGANPFLQTAPDFSDMEAIEFLEAENERLEGMIDILEDEIDLLDDQIDYVDEEIDDVEEELREHPDDPALLARLAELQEEKQGLEAQKADKEDLIRIHREEIDKNDQKIERIRRHMEDISSILREKAALAILEEIKTIRYTPFSISSARDPIFDLGDKVVFTGGMSDDETGCIMSFSYKLDTYSFNGYGNNPALTDARSSTDKSVTGAKNANKNALTIGFAVYRNSDQISINENDYVEIGRVNFVLAEDADIEAWVETKMLTTYNVDKLAGVQFHYFLDSTELDYHPVAEWKDEGTVPDLTLDGRTLVFSTMRSATQSIYHTLNYQYHLAKVASSASHVFKVMATGLEGSEIINIGDAHITLWATGLTGDQGWEGDLTIEENLPVYPIGVVSLIGNLSETATVSMETPAAADRILTEEGNTVITEDGNNVITE